MFEIGIFCVILIAVGYWATLFAMGRRDDVLHGHFVEPEPQAEPAASAPIAMPGPMPPAAPPRPPAPVVANAESLRSLLAVITQQLKDTARP
ncbi:hypothetical protein [Bradyrhizobium sp. NP1]|uniref:hypothetical protein n=1 Tax=Bradyrhizobium sp. NP1 TaxID=3049772 RepID=UPI0025A5B5B9|nr:hypothetical protein [Bradyrhizobium sp. NP1]WJR75411.1 hypothetical protein QOU61_21690 [Bradyrhizobium sp. NP1]